MKKRFLSMCLFVVMCLTISSPVLAVYNDDSVVTPNNNRYYYVYEYTNYKGPKCFTVSASDAAEEAAFRAVVTTGIGALAGYYAGGNMTVTKFTADMLTALLAFHKSFERSTFQARILPIPIKKGMLKYQ